MNLIENKKFLIIIPHTDQGVSSKFYSLVGWKRSSFIFKTNFPTLCSEAITATWTENENWKKIYFLNFPLCVSAQTFRADRFGCDVSVWTPIKIFGILRMKHRELKPVINEYNFNLLQSWGHLRNSFESPLTRPMPNQNNINKIKNFIIVCSVKSFHKLNERNNNKIKEKSKDEI